MTKCRACAGYSSVFDQNYFFHKQSHLLKCYICSEKTPGSPIVYQLGSKYSFSFLSFHKAVNQLYVRLPGLSIFSFPSSFAVFTGLRMKTYHYIKVACTCQKPFFGGGRDLVNFFSQGLEGFNLKCSTNDVLHIYLSLHSNTYHHIRLLNLNKPV